MNPRETLLLLAAITVVAFAWRSALQARERALEVCRRFCERRGLQLLDDTVELRSLAPARDAAGRLGWRRRYRFEFTADGETRLAGELVLHGLRLAALRAEGGFEEGAVLRAHTRWRK